MRATVFVTLVLSIAGSYRSNTIVEEKTSYSMCARSIQRYAIFPKGSAIIITSATTKHLVTFYPKAWMLSIEVDAYYDLPFSTTDTKPGKKTLGVTFANLKTKSNYQRQMRHRHGSNFYFKDVSKYPNWKDVVSISHNSSKLLIYRPRGNSLENRQLPKLTLSKRNKRDNHGKEIRDDVNLNEKRFGWNIEFCILRTFCEAKYVLLPHGLSLIQDVVRILFEFPMKFEWHEKLKTTHYQSGTNCRENFKNLCPVSFIEIILNHSEMFA